MQQYASVRIVLSMSPTLKTVSPSTYHRVAISVGSLRSQLKPRRGQKENMLEIVKLKVLKAETKPQIYSAEVKVQGRVLTHLHWRAL